MLMFLHFQSHLARTFSPRFYSAPVEESLNQELLAKFPEIDISQYKTPAQVDVGVDEMSSYLVTEGDILCPNDEEAAEDDGAHTKRLLLQVRIQSLTLWQCRHILVTNDDRFTPLFHSRFSSRHK